MSVNLIELIPQNLGYAPLKKIDPNTRDVVDSKKQPAEHTFAQAAIPAVLISLYNYSTTDEGAENILHGNISSDWTDIIFGDGKQEVINEIIAFSHDPAINVEEKLDAICNEAVRLVKENMPMEASITDVKKFLSGQRSKILPYLPESLHVGDALNNQLLDDNTHKMEGPISSFIRAIGNAFSEPVKDKEMN